MSRTPLLIVSDSASGTTGLGRIARELATRIQSELTDVFKVGVCGFGSFNSLRLPFMNYVVPLSLDYTIPSLPDVWQDFSLGEPGILLFIMNPTWLPWVANPDGLPDGKLKDFLKSDLTKKWIYAPIDSVGPGDKLTAYEGEILSRFDRVLAYNQFGAETIGKTLGREIDHLPHGTDETVFYPRDRKSARQTFVSRVTLGSIGVISEDTLLLGIVATNTLRKDFGLAFETCRELIDSGINLGVWVHANAARKYWDLPTLAEEFGLKGRVLFTDNHLNDDSMAWAYSACNVVLSIASGGGHELPGAEALACGVPAIHGNYAGGAAYTPRQFLVEPVAYRYEGFYGSKRPVFNPATWADKVIEVSKISERGEFLLDNRWVWTNCWSKWVDWLKAGL